MKYYPIELHAHTCHSDGDFSIHQLIQAAKEEPYQVLTVTDHNTFAPYEQWRKEKLEQNQQDDFDGNLLVVPGIEWTTFYGHMLVIGANQVIDWRQAQKRSLDPQLRQIKAAQGIVGIAHPFSIGSPICTGCHWDFHIEDYSLVDFIEVWNRTTPDENYRSQLAYEWWTSLLLQGERISCSGGRDWHRMEAPSENTAISYIGLETFTLTEVYQSLRQGNFYISLGPVMELSFQQAHQNYYLGDNLLPESGILQIMVQDTPQPRLQAFGFDPKTIRVIQNEQVVAEKKLTKGEPLRVALQLVPGYLRVEVLGTAKGQKNQRLILSNPFYIQES